MWGVWARDATQVREGVMRVRMHAKGAVQFREGLGDITQVRVHEDVQDALCESGRV